MLAAQRLSIRASLLMAAGVALTSVITLPTPTSADTVHVPSGQPTIQAGIDAAGQNGTVIIAPGTYTGAGNIDVDMRGLSVTVTGSGSSTTIIDCELAGRAFSLTSPNDTTAVIEQLTVRNGTDQLGGGIYISAASPTIRNCTFEDCSADDGGALYATGSASPTITDCTFTANTAGDGGALKILSYEGSITGCTFEDCVASNGGALCLDFPAELPLVLGCLFRGNTADIGGAVYYRNTETSIDDCTFFGNTATLGGGIYLASNSNYPEITRCSFVANDGGGAYSLMAEVTFSRCIFAFDRSAAGFACALPGWNPTVTHCVSFGNAGGDSLCGNHTSNLFEDPRLCGLATGDLTLCSNSQCVQGNNPWGVSVGAHEAGCGDCDSPVRSLSWGALKGIYRER